MAHSIFGTEMERQHRIIMGIDPGTNRMGYGLLEADGTRLNAMAVSYTHLTLPTNSLV